MKEKYVCDLCGKTHYELDGYVKCVVECGEKLKKLEEEEKNKKYLEELNAAINGVKQAKVYYEQKLNEFKEKYPAEYELNFASESCDCPSDCKGHCSDDDKKDNMKTKTFELKKLSDDQAVRFLAEMLGLKLI